MDISTAYKGNVLAITDEEVSHDWRLGLIRSLGKVVAAQGKVKEALGRFGNVLPDSMNAHMATCSIADVSTLVEDSDEESQFDTFQDRSTNITTLTGTVTCACGRVKDEISIVTIYAGELIQLVVNG